MEQKSEKPDKSLEKENNKEVHRSDDSMNINSDNSSDPEVEQSDSEIRNWNSNSGFPKGDRSREIGNNENKIGEDSGIFDDEDEDEVL